MFQKLSSEPVFTKVPENVLAVEMHRTKDNHYFHILRILSVSPEQALFNLTEEGKAELYKRMLNPPCVMNAPAPNFLTGAVAISAMPLNDPRAYMENLIKFLESQFKGSGLHLCEIALGEKTNSLIFCYLDLPTFQKLAIEYPEHLVLKAVL